MIKQFDVQSLRPVSYYIPSASTTLNVKDYFGAIKVRWGFGRNNYIVKPGLYKVGKPNSESDVFISANYKLSFDTLRKNLKNLNAWILVIDTKGVNVWCAAGKKTFSTDNIVKSIKNTTLDKIVKHRKIIVPQLGAPGVAAHEVKEQSGFRVVYGPVRARDIKPFIDAGYKATTSMRRVTFTLKDRAKLIPVDLMYGKYRLLLALGIVLILSGIDSAGFSLYRIIKSAFFPLSGVLGAYIAGIVIAPLMLPYTPFRAFALKGAIWGAIAILIIKQFFQVSVLEFISIGLLCITIASFVTMNFTGSSTYTSLSGVKKEMKWAIPIQIVFASAGIILFVISKLL